jgi:hypothetical protein
VIGGVIMFASRTEVMITGAWSKIFRIFDSLTSNRLAMLEEPNQTPEPMTKAVTIPAYAGLAPAGIMAHLKR